MLAAEPGVLDAAANSDVGTLRGGVQELFNPRRAAVLTRCIERSSGHSDHWPFAA
jgi:hypothetical protein